MDETTAHITNNISNLSKKDIENLHESIKSLKWFLKYRNESCCGSDIIEANSENYFYINDENAKAFETAIDAMKLLINSQYGQKCVN